jgi:AraC family transcriptional regulator
MTYLCTESFRWYAKSCYAGYIEDNLTEQIDLNQVARRACCSSYNFQRLFSFITGISLAEYIRRRRLTLAAVELQSSGIKVVDLAVKYGYDSPVSFARAFQALHEIPPSAARKPGMRLKAFPRLTFQISIKGEKEMNYRLLEKPAFRMVGMKENISLLNEQNFAQIPKFWDRAKQAGKWEALCRLSGEKPPHLYGVCACFGENDFDYYIAVMSDRPAETGMEELSVPACTWAVFEAVGPIPEAIQAVTRRIFTEWFPASGYEHAEAPEIEWYAEGDTGDREYKSEVWIPIVKNQA